MEYKNIIFDYEESLNQEARFTPAHVIYKCVIKANNKQYTFDYQCNPVYNEPNLEDCIECLVMDANSYESATDADDFIKEFGYDTSLADVRKGEKVYKACGKTYKALIRIFGKEGYEKMLEAIYE